MSTNHTQTRPIGRCPANGMGRAAWFRRLAEEVADPDQAEACRRTAELIEANVIGTLPLIRLMNGEA